MTPGCATGDGTRGFESRFPGPAMARFFRDAREWRVSSLGLGTYLGAPDDLTDLAYYESVLAAVRGGVNFVDTAINYRHQRSERVIGAALAELFRTGVAREEIVVATKAGFLVPGALPAGLQAEDVAGGLHSMAPRFLADQIERSRANLDLETIDVFYLHNPETQLNFVPRTEFESRLRLAFTFLEEAAAKGILRYYGTATWHGYRRPADSPDALALARLVEIAAEVAGPQHRFRFVQLPLNLAMPEALTQSTQRHGGTLRTILEAAAASGITVVASASLFQGRLTQRLPAPVSASLPGPATDAERAIQFARSAPGVTVALAGMSSVAHLRENLGVAAYPPAAREEFLRVFAPAR